MTPNQRSFLNNIIDECIRLHSLDGACGRKIRRFLDRYACLVILEDDIDLSGTFSARVTRQKRRAMLLQLRDKLLEYGPVELMLDCPRGKLWSLSLISLSTSLSVSQMKEKLNTLNYFAAIVKQLC